MSNKPAPNPLAINGRAQTPPNLYSSMEAMKVDGRNDAWRADASAGFSSYPRPDGLLPAFSTAHYSHLPTPLSPSDASRLFHGAPHFAPESPSHQSSQPFNAAAGSLTQRFSQRSFVDEGHARTPHHPQQVATPDSSPHISRLASSRQPTLATSSYQTPTRSFASPSRLSLDSSILTTPPNPNRSVQPSSSSPEPPPASTLSSPFQAKATPKASRSPPAFSPPTQSEASSSNATATTSTQPGGEMERIRQAAREERLSQLKEAEARRPDYLKRSIPDPNAMVEDERPVGIMETPIKGRRIKLFQETSEESFEESLMAGGYGRYRTAEWVRQPQPLSSVLTGTSNVVKQLETVQEEPPQPPTEKELKKRKRLEAFRSSRSEGSTRSRLIPVELEGKGRVLLEIPREPPHHNIPGIIEPPQPPTKKRATPSKRRTKKGSAEVPSKDRRGSEQPVGTEDVGQKQKPNWPDAEFPWKLRMEEREEAAKMEEQERMKIIGRYFDGDSDEDEAEPPPIPDPEDEDVRAPQGAQSFLDPEKLAPPRMGRGKHVPLLAHPEDPRKSSQHKRLIFPTDPGDARAALLAKRSVRALSYRQQRRQRELNDDGRDIEDLCVCHGKDDGRELVQCDGCQTWYHLECLGIRDVEELGPEEDPWFCRRCLRRSPSPNPAPELVADVQMSEPTFAPTDETPSRRASSTDATLYPPSTVHDSPSWLPQRMPKTPTRSHATIGQAHHQGPSWSDFSKHPSSPTTPKSSAHSIRVYAPTNTPSGDSHGYRVVEESPFDPTSTPSRGIRFSGPGPFSTPKNAWGTRPGPLSFQTPSRHTYRADKGHRGSFGGPGTLSAALDDNSRSITAHIESLGLKPALHPMMLHAEESPVRGSAPRNRSRDARRGGLGESPMNAMPRFLEESPVMRTMKDRSARA